MDFDSQLYNFGARDYKNNMAVFMTPDWSSQIEPVPYAKMDNPQSLNLYAYAGGNPVSIADLDGHDGNPCGENAAGVSGCGAAGGNGAVPDTGGGWVPPPPNFDFQVPHGEDDPRKGIHIIASGSLWQHLGNLFHFHSWNYGMRESVTVRILPNFYSANVEAGPFSQSVSFVPSTGNSYYSPGVGTGSGISLTAGWATDPNGFAGGPSGSVCLFDGVGGCASLSSSGDYAGQIGIGIGGWGTTAGYGIDPISATFMGMAEGEAVDPLATKTGDVYMEDPQMWIPQN